MAIKVISFGVAYRQITGLNFPVGDGLPKEKEIVGGAYEVTAASSALNFAQVIDGLGVETSFIGKVGDDVDGRDVTDLIAKSGVTPHLIVDPQVQTNYAINFVDQTDSVMTVIGTASASVTAEEVDSKLKEVGSEGDILYLGGCFKMKSLLADGYINIIENAHKLGMKVALDHGRVHNLVTDEEKETMRKMVGIVDMYFPSSEEFAALWGDGEFDEKLKELRNHSRAIICVKDGVNGVYGMKDENIVHVPAFSVPVRNTVGAGDSFNAGFIKAQIDEKSFEESLRCGCATAAVMISESGFPSTERVEAFLMPSQ